MKPLSIWLPLILIASALFLSVAKNALEPSPRPAQQPNEGTAFGQQQRSEQESPIGGAYLSQAPQQGSAPNPQENHNIDTSNVVIIISTVVSALAAIAIGVFNYQLVGVTREMVRATEVAAKAAQMALHADRPYLLVAVVSTETHKHLVLDRLDRDEPISRGKVSFQNAGSGPAELIEVVAASSKFDTLTDFPEPTWDNLVGNQPEQLEMPIVGVGGFLGPFTIQIHWTEDDIELVEAGLKRVALYGYVRYRSGPKEEYFTRFFWWFSPLSSPTL